MIGARIVEMTAHVEFHKMILNCLIRGEQIDIYAITEEAQRFMTELVPVEENLNISEQDLDKILLMVDKINMDLAQNLQVPFNVFETVQKANRLLAEQLDRFENLNGERPESWHIMTL